MPFQNSQCYASLLRQFIQPTPNDLGVDGKWTWKPNVKIDVVQLKDASPTTEYSSVEGNE